MDAKQFPPNLGLSFFGRGGAGVNFMAVFQTHFNPNNSFYILLQISLLFMCTSALIQPQKLLIFLFDIPVYLIKISHKPLFFSPNLLYPVVMLVYFHSICTD